MIAKSLYKDNKSNKLKHYINKFIDYYLQYKSLSKDRKVIDYWIQMFNKTDWLKQVLNGEFEKVISIMMNN